MNRLLRIEELSVSDIQNIMSTALFIKNKHQYTLHNKVCGLLFFEPSTRTSSSFEAAIYKLGGQCIKFTPSTSSMKKGESFYDTICTMKTYCDALIIRHPDKCILDDIVKYFPSTKIISAGIGDGEHPTQALLDLYTIQKYHTRYPDKIVFVGDVKHSRTIHSLVYLLHKVKSTIKYVFVCPLQLQPSGEFEEFINMNNVNYCIWHTLDNIHIKDCDVIYMTRMQKERHINQNDNTLMNNVMILNNDILKMTKSNCIVLHPLPRNEELPREVDMNPKCKYFEQMENGVYVRMAILDIIFSENTETKNIIQTSNTIIM